VDRVKDLPIMTRFPILVLMALFAVTPPVIAQDQTGLNVDTTATGAPGGVARYDMAQALYALGVAAKDPVLALTAGKLAASVRMTDVKRDGVQTRAKGVDEAADEATAPADTGMMFAAARAYAADDENLRALIDGVATEDMRGLNIGASRQINTLPAGALDVWKIPFFGASYAEIGVKGDGDTQLLVTVADENGNEITCPARVEDRFYCDFVPRWNGFFNISVRNAGSRKNTYFLLTN
jgi:hypothetical protein